MDNIIIRKGRTGDSQDFSQLILLSAATFFPSIFASYTEEVMRKIFQQPGNLFSFEHSYFIEVNDRIAGMALGYNWEQKRREEEKIIFITKIEDRGRDEVIPNEAKHFD